MAKKLSPQQEIVVDQLLSGKTERQAALAAGFTSASASSSRSVQTVLDEARTALARATNIRKQDVLNGILEAIDRAKSGGEPGTEIKGWTEVAKMLGYYAPEVKKIQLSMDQGRMKSKFEALSDEELIELASKPVIEGQFTHVN
jgi:phage terminase small subunit